MKKISIQLVNNPSYMDKVTQDELQSFISESVITPFYKKRFDKLEELTLNKILRRKNPYLFKAKNIQTSEELVKYTLDAFLSSQEETIFGNLMEELAIFICSKVFNGYKAEQGKFRSIDLSGQYGPKRQEHDDERGEDRPALGWIPEKLKQDK